ncbi:hypothetical protein LCGC14_2838400 [marine sediment metagenome]|uniref:Uncharacterized protein n=1 Tax=marine sediment metagenome TaxID=412755 RepID=A0A0F9AKE8_9ZZZZ
MIAKDVLNAMQILRQAKQLDPYRSHIDKLNEAVLKMDDELTFPVKNISEIDVCHLTDDGVYCLETKVNAVWYVIKMINEDGSSIPAIFPDKLWAEKALEQMTKIFLSNEAHNELRVSFYVREK